eukprot:gene20001-14576_t
MTLMIQSTKRAMGVVARAEKIATNTTTSMELSGV